MGSLDWVDLIVVVVVIGSVVGALRGRVGILGALGSALGAALLCWLIAAALLAWAPPQVRTPVADSAFVALVPPPASALLGIQHWLSGIRP